MKFARKESPKYAPPTIRWLAWRFSIMFLTYFLIFFVAYPDVRFSEEERNHFGRFGTFLVYGATLMTMLGLIHDPRVKEGEKLRRAKLEKRHSDLLLNEGADADRSADIAACKVEINAIQAELIPYEQYPGTIRRVIPFAIGALAAGTAFLLMSYG